MKIISIYFLGYFPIFLTIFIKNIATKKSKSEVIYGQTVLDCSEN